MSQENVARLLEIYDLFNERFAELKAGDVDPLLEFFGADVVIKMVDAPDPATYVGHDGVRQWFDDVYGVWESVHVEAEGFIESGDWTIAQLQCTLRGEASGVELELPITAVHQFRNGRIVRDRLYLDRADALEAVGLREWPMSQENVVAVRRSVDAFNRGDRTTWLTLRDQDCEMVPIGDWADVPAIRGCEAVWDVYRDVAETVSFPRAYFEILAAGEDKVIGHQRHEAHGHRSGADVEVDYWLVITFREGKIAREEWFTDRAEALEAVGLRE